MGITWEEYTEKTGATAVFPPERALEYLGLGLAGEAGETAGKISKVIRDKGGALTNEDRRNLTHELGDVLWFVARLADHIGVPLEAIAQHNVDKLADRAKRGVIHGNGDNR